MPDVQYSPIPQPPAIPFLGNVTAIDSELPNRSFVLLAKQYGSIYQLYMFGKQIIVVNSQHLSHQVADERRFRKSINPTLQQVRHLVEDGLFTAYHHEPVWGIAHRILMPAFGPNSIRSMFPDMLDIASQLVLKWSRFGPKHPIDPADDFTRLAFDTLALCAMNYRLNSYYQQDLPPFIKAMANFLVESGNRARRPKVVQALMRETNNKYWEDAKLMNDLAEQIVAERKANPIEKDDLLNKMLNGRDPKTGQGLSDQNIRNQLVTFLIAGHETTSGLLSFAVYNIVKNPHAYAKLQAEIDEVLGEGEITLGDLSKLHYLQAVLRETLRLSSPITGRSAEAIEETFLEGTDGEKYHVPKEAVLAVMYSVIHRDPAVWGDDVDEFKPERMMGGKFEALPPNAWEPFGNGLRACIGRPFAWQEAIIALAVIMQSFDLRLYDESYTLKLKQTLTIKPHDLKIRAIPRTGRNLHFNMSHGVDPDTSTKNVKDNKVETIAGKETQKLYVYYGSNTGTSEGFAQAVVGKAAAHGFDAELATLDSAVNRLPTNGPVAIFTASFEGEPADNAGHFVQYLQNLSSSTSLQNVSYAVFGSGNREWIHTYQKVPRFIDEALKRNGAKQLLERGEGDAGGNRLYEDFDDWEGKFWEILKDRYGSNAASSDIGTGFKVTLTKGTERSSSLRQDAALGRVIERKILTKDGAPTKIHIEIELPEEMTYKAGDYLNILPTNPPSVVKRVLNRFGLSDEQQISISTSGPTTLPTDRPISVVELLKGYVELNQPATKRNLQTLTSLDASFEQELSTLPIQDNRLSVLDILESLPKLPIGFSTYLQMLPAMRIRQYSISSSPLWNPNRVTLTVSVLDSPSLSGKEERFLGICSNFLASLNSDDRVQISVRPSAIQFHLPDDISTPIILFAAGSGMAPMRGFIQERAAQVSAGRVVGKVLLFYGCRDPELDYLYADAELGEWMKAGVVEVFPAFSRVPERSEGCKYVQDRIWKERQIIEDTFQKGAKLYTCGSAAVSNGVKDACVRIIQHSKEGVTKEQAQKYFLDIQKERFATDIFG